MSKQIADDRLLDSMRQRLHVVADQLQLVAEMRVGRKKSRALQIAHQGEVEADEDRDPARSSPTKLVHDLRVSCRRAETALKVGKRRLTSKQANWFRNQLHKIRNSCNTLRDDEVLRKWLRQQTASEAQQRLIKSVSKNVKAGCRAVAARSRSFVVQHHFRQRIHDLRQKALPTDGNSLPSNRATSHGGQRQPQEFWRLELGQWLFDALNRLVQTLSDGQDDFDVLHQLRVRVKHLRYGLELVMELEPESNLDGGIELMHEMQDKLGALHDAIVRLPRLKAEFAEASGGAEIITGGVKDLEACLVDWRQWWKHKVLDQIVAECSRAAARLSMPVES